MSYLSNLGLLSVKGPDAKSFLQGQVTCNLNEVSPTQSRLGAHCNLQGRMLSIFRIYQANEALDNPQYILSMPASMVPLALHNFKKYALFSKVSIDDVSATLTVMGENGATLQDKALKELQINECIHKKLAQGNQIICRIPGVQPRFEVIATLPIAAQIEGQSSHEWELQDIQAGIPTIYPETASLILPHHANLSLLGGISYDKGCYLGQEIIARMQYRGNIKKQMVAAFLPEGNPAPTPGTPVFAHETTGMVVRAAPMQSGYALLVILDSTAANLENVHLFSLDGPLLTALQV